ncbi:MRX complex DNA-binding subunit [Maudiozyma humilis]|uniref:DNA repair protein RAD50 n=1 Tax=Maudiozyma humilis TaxID=51915 RepID=A0AAV5S5V1_MAUHU|nr:MRX complex DNA-binding subunit [Kazachstania humilis]
MSSVYKLSIQGIRSFDSNDRETIEFGTPLTLIVGMNGSGKTTIIECLKYATTGDLPPNSKGGVFIHDPKITGEKDVRAQVKLAFTSANGLSMIVTRNIQLLSKRTTNTFKTLEGQLVAINKVGERTTLSTRSAELDSQVPLYMGVPKAILEYVIFCHQEDSLWPLSEPSNLKKKFDEIFQAMKFTKALDNLKTIKKDMSVDIKLLKQSVEHMKLDRDRSKATKMNIYQLEAKVGEFQSEVEGIEAELRVLTEKSDRLFKSNQDFQEVLSKLDNLRTLKSITTNDISRIEKSVEQIELPLVEIEDMLNNFNNTIDVKEKEIGDLEESMELKRKESVQLRQFFNQLIGQQGELKAKEEQYRKTTENLAALIKTLSETYSLSYTDSDASAFMDVLDRKMKEITDDINEFTESSNASIGKIETTIKDLTYQETVQQQKVDYLKADKEKIDKRLEEMKIKKEHISYEPSDLNQAKEHLAQLSNDLLELDKNSSKDDIVSSIRSKNDAIVQLESAIEEVQNKISKTNEHAELFAKLDISKESLKGKEKQYSEIEGILSSDEKLKSWNLPVTNDLDVDFKRFFINLQKSIALSNRDLNEKTKKYTETIFHRNTIQEDIAKNNEALNKIKSTLKEALPEDCPIEEYDDFVQESEQSYKTALENLKMHQTTLEFNRKALEVANDKDCCYLCSRKFETDEFRSKILEELRQKTDAKFEVTLKDIVQEEKTNIEELRSLEKYVVQLKSLQKSNEAITNQLTTINENLGTFEKDQNDAEQTNKNLKEDKEYSERILRAQIDKYFELQQDISKLKIESSKISQQLEMYGNKDGKVQSVSELQQEQRTKQEEIRRLRREISEQQDLREERNKEHAMLADSLREADAKINDIEKCLNDAEELESALVLGLDESTKMNQDIAQFSSNVESLKNKRDNSAKQLENERNDQNTQLESKRKAQTTFSNDFSKYANMLHNIQDFEGNGMEALATCISKSDETSGKLMNLDNSIEELSNVINVRKQKLQDSNNEQRNLRDNIELLKLKSKLRDIDTSIQQLDIQNAEIEREKYQEESSKIRNQYEKLTSENAGKMGEIKQLQNQIDALNRQLQSDYKNIDEKYRKEWVELQTRTFVTDDIDTYSKTLDNAIMRYHGLKMEDINRIIDELWKRTYSGTDIDTIKIQSDEVANKTRGKSYNYRVVMYKQDAELDMRGRCSAGQKVLASIIIRLALSETFGINCGVIALDEPTTNLDEENIESLAKSLSNIIEFRRHQKNFQLIVITHDEKFLNYMNASDFTDHFFKVKRDDRQKSQIEWVDINKVTEN